MLRCRIPALTGSRPSVGNSPAAFEFVKELAIFSRRVATLTVAILCLPWLPPARAAADAASAPPRASLSVGEAVAGMLGYARWPEAPTPLRLCLLGGIDNLTPLTTHLTSAYTGYDFELRVLGDAAPQLAGCSALYVGTYDAAGWRHLAPHLSAQAVLTICERSDACSNVGMFSLEIAPDGSTRFEVNLDAVARSRVRVHPQVLRLGQRGAAK